MRDCSCLCVCLHQIGCIGFHGTFVVFVFVCVFLLLNMYQEYHAAFWSDSPSPQENRNNLGKLLTRYVDLITKISAKLSDIHKR